MRQGTVSWPLMLTFVQIRVTRTTYPRKDARTSRTNLPVGTDGDVFHGGDLLLIHLSYPYRNVLADPSISRMDAVHRCAVAYLWKSHSVRRDAVMHVFFRDGVLRLTSQVRSAFPPRTAAPWSRPFLEAINSSNSGASFERYGAGGCSEAIRRRASQDSAPILLDASGLQLHIRSALPGDDLSRVPRRFCYVVGGPRGFAPFSSENVASFIERDGGPKVCAVSLRGGVQFSSAVIAFLQVCNESGQLRPSLARFYGGARAELAKFDSPP